MRTATAEAEVRLAPEAALRLWTDLSRWPTFVEGFARVVEVDPGWPGEGSRVIWESIPSGRGRVTEKVIENAPGEFATMVFEDRLSGKQALRAIESEGGRVTRDTSAELEHEGH